MFPRTTTNGQCPDQKCRQLALGAAPCRQRGRVQPPAGRYVRGPDFPGPLTLGRYCRDTGWGVNPCGFEWVCGSCMPTLQAKRIASG